MCLFPSEYEKSAAIASSSLTAVIEATWSVVPEISEMVNSFNESKSILQVWPPVGNALTEMKYHMFSETVSQLRDDEKWEVAGL